MIKNNSNSIKGGENGAAFYRKSLVCKKLAVSSSTLDRLVKNNTFPRPFVLGEPGYSRSVGWSAEEVESWINSRERVVE
jgi:predicted DNA-binding transcriptional regulator AlpA